MFQEGDFTIGTASFVSRQSAQLAAQLDKVEDTQYLVSQFIDPAT